MSEKEGRDKRRFERTPCKIKITYTILSSNDATPYEYGIMSSQDLSEGGICVVTDRPVATPILVQLNLSIPMRPFHLLVLGKTVRCSPCEGGLYEIGIKFVGILPANFKEILANYVVSSQSESTPATSPSS